MNQKFSEFSDFFIVAMDYSPEYYQKNYLDVFTNSAKFYYPAGAELINGKLVSQYQDLLKLPYPTISILAPTFVKEDPTQKGSKIVIAMRHDSPDLEPLNLCNTINELIAGYGDAFSHGFVLSCCVGFNGQWGPPICFGFIAFFNDRIDYGIVPIQDSRNGLWDYAISRGYDAADDLACDASTVMNLALMLSMENTSTKNITPSKGHSKRRRKQGKPDLHCYKILLVDGKRWGEGDGTGESPARRTHLRRGHIRRLRSGKVTFVRECVVTGSQPGFVEKEYKVKH